MPKKKPVRKSRKIKVTKLRLSGTYTEVPLSFGVDKSKEIMDDEVRERLGKFKIKVL
jgi:hypothetical protein